MQLFLITHLTAVRVLFIIGIVLVVLPVIFFIIKKKKKLRVPSFLTRTAGISIAAGVLCFILPIYYVYLDVQYNISEYTRSDILYIASESMNVPAVERMLKKGAAPSKTTRFGKTAVVKMMIAYGADVNDSGADRYTPLCAACRNGDLPMVQLLLTNGADPDYRPDKYVSALSSAAAADDGYNYELINLLCAAGANRQALSRDSRGAVMVPFKYYFHKTVGRRLTPDEEEAYEKIAALLEDDYRKWVMENATFLNDNEDKEFGELYEAVS